MAVQSSNAQLNFDFPAFLQAWNDIPFHDLRLLMLRDAEPLIEHGLFNSIAPYLESSIIRRDKCKSPLFGKGRNEKSNSSDFLSSIVYTNATAGGHKTGNRNRALTRGENSNSW